MASMPGGLSWGRTPVTSASAQSTAKGAGLAGQEARAYRPDSMLQESAAGAGRMQLESSTRETRPVGATARRNSRTNRAACFLPDPVVCAARSLPVEKGWDTMRDEAWRLMAHQEVGIQRWPLEVDPCPRSPRGPVRVRPEDPMLLEAAACPQFSTAPCSPCSTASPLACDAPSLEAIHGSATPCMSRRPSLRRPLRLFPAKRGCGSGNNEHGGPHV
jgi:hypothetical protein